MEDERERERERERGRNATFKKEEKKTSGKKLKTSKNEWEFLTKTRSAST
jgi:hypothetical protein